MTNSRRRLLALVIIGGLAMAALVLTRPGGEPERGVFIPHPESEHAAGKLTVHFGDSVPQDRWDDVLSAYGAELDGKMVLDGFAVISVPEDRRAEIGEALAESGAVRSVEEITYRYPAATPDDPLWLSQWNMRLVTADDAWDFTRGEGVRVAIIDTGVAYEDFGVFKRAPDLAGTFFADPHDFYDSDDHANDENGHGTHVAGTIAQTTNNSYGLAGVAYEATIIPVKVCGPPQGGNPRDVVCPTSAIADGIRWATDHGARVINISLAAPGNVTEAERAALEYASGAGAVVVAAAGNGGTDSKGDPILDYPAAVEGVISVAASGFNGSRSYYSNYGAGEAHNLDLIAPGGNPPILGIPNEGLTSVITQESYRFFCDKNAQVEFQTMAFCPYAGTSMAAAHVSGIAAMIRSAFPALNKTQARTLLQCSSADVGDPGVDLQTGHGLVQADAALQDHDGDEVPDCLDDEPFTPTPSPTPSPTPVPPPNTCEAPTPTPAPPTPTPTETASASPRGTPGASNGAAALPAGPTDTETPTATPLDTSTPGGDTPTPDISTTPTEEPTPTPTETPSPMPTVQAIPCGDVDCNYRVDSRDALWIISFMAFVEPTAPCLGKGYVNCDEALDQIDALVILRYSGGVPLNIPANCPGVG
ncbi:MAG: S8 family serine peptidase [Dehalococcoidia bacterium]